MKIGIDFRLANASHRGMARYCREIVHLFSFADGRSKFFLQCIMCLIHEFGFNADVNISFNMKSMDDDCTTQMRLL